MPGCRCHSASGQSTRSESIDSWRRSTRCGGRWRGSGAQTVVNQNRRFGAKNAMIATTMKTIPAAYVIVMSNQKKMGDSSFLIGLR